MIKFLVTILIFSASSFASESVDWTHCKDFFNGGDNEFYIRMQDDGSVKSAIDGMSGDIGRGYEFRLRLEGGIPDEPKKRIEYDTKVLKIHDRKREFHLTTELIDDEVESYNGLQQRQFITVDIEIRNGICFPSDIEILATDYSSGKSKDLPTSQLDTVHCRQMYMMMKDYPIIGKCDSEPTVESCREASKYRPFDRLLKDIWGADYMKKVDYTTIRPDLGFSGREQKGLYMSQMATLLVDQMCRGLFKVGKVMEDDALWAELPGVEYDQWGSEVNSSSR